MWHCMNILGVIRANQESLAGHCLPVEYLACASQSPSWHADFAIKDVKEGWLIAGNVKIFREASTSAS